MSTHIRRAVAALLTGLLTAVASVGCAAADGSSPGSPLVAVYRGEAACDGCPETIAQRLRASLAHAEVVCIGRDERLPLQADSLADVDLYVQPEGGDDIGAAAEALPPRFVGGLERYVASGGRYLGLCMGAYLAGPVAFGLVETDLDGEVGRPGFAVTDSRSTVVDVAWDGQHRQTFFQEGAVLPPPDDRADVFARYGNGDIAASRYDHGDGMAGLIGPHPEADKTWLDEAAITDPDGDDWKYAVPFVQTLLD
ncbi:BPL-N domain-containing protein [Brevibacterium limosum]|uniref:BPL-N domain-containing protein n=1 Tax=Brevibacterium limosum TaxID=2697565 RepID=UPI001423C6B4|nr:BPL-N domain-containing protein [Brevibacterium limosum]